MVCNRSVAELLHGSGSIRCSTPSSTHLTHPNKTSQQNLNKLDRDGIMIIYRLPFKAGKVVYWPPFTRAWSTENWNALCDVPNVQAKEAEEQTLRMALGAVAEGGKVFEQVLGRGRDSAGSASVVVVFTHDGTHSW
ncbi:hypothetical protein N0V82_007397 [Gnomoniopsis sp. IMI 355080]|nr:hypothetical protein N0V82_007397 [Gnomoniopsis sp. IMI 355080]